MHKKYVKECIHGLNSIYRQEMYKRYLCMFCMHFMHACEQLHCG
jgi:hypothetical protein